MSGRPSDYTLEIEIAICELIADGQSLREICRADDMPSRETVYQWMDKRPSFADRYARAVEDRAEKLAQEILDIADEKTGDYEVKDGQMVFNSENVARSRLKVDSRKWIASKLFPKKYGDRIQNDTELNVKGQIIVQSAPTDEAL